MAGNDKGASGSKRVVILIGSVRAKSNTARAARVVAAELESLGFESDVIDPRELDLVLPGLEKDDSLRKSLQARVRESAGAVLVTPEYDGSFSSVIKLLIEHLGYPSVLAGKPVHLLGVASGRIGAIKALEHLRSVCGTIGAVLLPGSKSVEAVHRIFDDQGKCIDPQADTTIRSVARDIATWIG